MRYLISLLSIFVSFTILHAQMDIQPEYPEVGQRCPDFVLHNIVNYQQKTASLSSFSGKWLVLDFWNRGCGSCVLSFPKTSALQKKFGDRVQFMMVGIQDPEGLIQPMYEKFREKEHLIMPCAFDSIVANRFDVYTSPYIIIIDDKGIVQGITFTIDSTDIQNFLAGHPPVLRKAYRMHEDSQPDGFPFDVDKPFLINQNGGVDSDFLFRSVLSRWKPFVTPGHIPEGINENIDKGQFQVLAVPLFALYNYAYWGKYSPSKGEGNYDQFHDQPILDMKDSSLFSYSYKSGTNVFCYSQIFPRTDTTEEGVKIRMQQDLRNYFGYDVKIEIRVFPCWKLVASKAAQSKLPTKGGPLYYHTIPHADFEARNWPFTELLGVIRRCSDLVVLDETGIQGNIDISMKCIQTDFNDVSNALRANGLELLPANKEMRVLVITDKNRNAKSLIIP